MNTISKLAFSRMWHHWFHSEAETWTFLTIYESKEYPDTFWTSDHLVTCERCRYTWTAYVAWCKRYSQDIEVARQKALKVKRYRVMG